MFRGYFFNRIIIYLAGLFLVSLGIVLCVKCGLGVSPISSVPYVLGYITPLTFGTLTMLFHFMNSFFQYILERKLINVKVLLQIPVAFLFGVVIDILKNAMSFEANGMGIKIILMILSILCTAFGMHLMLSMDLVQNPPDGTVNLIAHMMKRNIGTVKICYDVSMIILSIVIGYLSMSELIGFGVATLCSAIFVGKILAIFREHLSIKCKPYEKEQIIQRHKESR
ncbi:MAG: DUF6198 family protein [Eubacteriales bacterium]|nr:DUF6198 family protein [Eubacteriales bacterium]